MAPGVIQHPGRSVRQGGPEDQLQEDRRNGLPPVPGGRNTVGGGVRAMDDWCRNFLLGEAECPSTVLGVRVGDGVRVAGILPTDAAWEGNGQEMALGGHC